MNWIVLSLMTALSVSSQDAWVKKYFSDLSPYEMILYPMIYSFPMFLLVALFIPVPENLGSSFFIYFIVGIPLNAVAFIMHMKAIKISPLSLTVPYLAFTPAFIILTGYIFLDEMPNKWGVFGIVTTCAGCYVLNLDSGKWSFLSPLKAVFKETGSWLMLIVSFLYSFGAAIGKKTILLSSPLFFTMSFFAALNLCLFIFLLGSGKIQWKTFTKEPVKGFIAGCLLFSHAFFHGFAVSLTKAAYMISVKRLSVVFGIIYGGMLFKEENIVMRFCGALFMLAGAVLITLKGR
ncbi:MAG: DMT family transporter [Desulfobacterales bacterium]|nr:DMT family transporter [Desulfobacterales bacterium]